MNVKQNNFQKIRAGFFTSSKASLLIPRGKRAMTDDELAAYRMANPKSKATTIADGFSDAGLSYIMERLYERRHAAPVDSVNTIQTQWGLACERYLFNIIETHYELLGDVPLIHPTYDFWRGSPDAINHKINAVTEIKCPYTRLSFSRLVEPLYRGLTGIDAMNFIRNVHSEGEAYYWQIVSNAVLTNKNTGELIVFLPRTQQVQEIREMLYGLREEEQLKFNRIWMLEDDRVPHLADDAEYSGINTIVFDIPESDKELLTLRMIDANNELTKLINDYAGNY